MNTIQWRELERARIFKTKIFDIVETRCAPPEDACSGTAGRAGVFTVIESKDWAIVIPVVEQAGEKALVMVRQWRHGALEESLELPGGVVEAGEAPEAGARRELLEETGYRAGTLVKLAEMSPNPAIMANRVHFFLATDLTAGGSQALDADEYVAVEILPEKDVLCGMGKPPFIHALMAAALHFYHNAALCSERAALCYAGSDGTSSD
jgi:8-oxo-dGTP pyrophosphatase MutT (NUDIX family)